MKKTQFITGLCVFVSLYLNAQTTSFDNLNANPLINKAITWTSSNYGSGFGHRIINYDPGFLTLLKFQGRHNSTAWSDIMVLTSNGNVGIGSANPDSKLSVNGNIHTKEVKVDLMGWSDFVFKDGYNLPTLEEVEQYIKEKGHLKDIPNEADVKENGVFLGDMDSKLLQKIEELTLYTIQQQKQIDALLNRIVELENKK